MTEPTPPQPSPADSGLYLVPYWVRGGRLWSLILLLLVFGGLVVPIVLSVVQRRAVSRGFGRGAAASLCSLLNEPQAITEEKAVAQLKELQVSFERTGAIDPESFRAGVNQVAQALPACQFLAQP